MHWVAYCTLYTQYTTYCNTIYLYLIKITDKIQCSGNIDAGAINFVKYKNSLQTKHLTDFILS